MLTVCVCVGVRACMTAGACAKQMCVCVRVCVRVCACSDGSNECREPRSCAEHPQDRKELWALLYLGQQALVLRLPGSTTAAGVHSHALRRLAVTSDPQATCDNHVQNGHTMVSTIEHSHGKWLASESTHQVHVCVCARKRASKQRVNIV